MVENAKLSSVSRKKAEVSSFLGGGRPPLIFRLRGRVPPSSPLSTPMVLVAWCTLNCTRFVHCLTDRKQLFKTVFTFQDASVQIRRIAKFCSQFISVEPVLTFSICSARILAQFPTKACTSNCRRIHRPSLSLSGLSPSQRARRPHSERRICRMPRHC